SPPIFSEPGRTYVRWRQTCSTCTELLIAKSFGAPTRSGRGGCHGRVKHPAGRGPRGGIAAPRAGLIRGQVGQRHRHRRAPPGVGRGPVLPVGVGLLVGRSRA